MRFSEKMALQNCLYGVFWEAVDQKHVQEKKGLREPKKRFFEFFGIFL